MEEEENDDDDNNRVSATKKLNKKIARKLDFKSDEETKPSYLVVNFYQAFLFLLVLKKILTFIFYIFFQHLYNYLIKRGPYNFYSEELKKKSIRDFFLLKDIKKAADLNNIKVKNLKRWISVGHLRKEGNIFY